MKRHLFAAVTAAVLALSLASCGKNGNNETEDVSSSAAQTEYLVFNGVSYSLSLDKSKWIDRDRYIEQLKNDGYSFSDKDIKGQGAEGSYFFTDESVKKGMTEENFTYDVPYLIIPTPLRSSSFKGTSIEDAADAEIADFKATYEKIDGMQLDESASGITEVGGRKFLKVVVRNSLADGQIVLVRQSYEIIDHSTKYSFNFSSTEELSERMSAEYEEVLKTLAF
ncbi:hypothetical protein SAMN02910447_02299 [Ruminococcus sp. YE71]|uniref:hypothetical protein n=1 Tax=unclassified Ruminococcus TaxID=2608920 RepID=UPI00088DC949|nr:MULTISPECIES: hypothetical protein [unclassified Ruminococcus]SDA23192.1 hypothetical protein SAMN02910446_02166 [Ruminococcus sp. YE78]SFW39400.1 hypothetical protein SAMN02910447_02299 [Ruminococcus sp. YE71]